MNRKSLLKLPFLIVLSALVVLIIPVTSTAKDAYESTTLLYQNGYKEIYEKCLFDENGLGRCQKFYFFLKKDEFQFVPIGDVYAVTERTRNK